MDLEAESISDELDGMWKTLHKLFRAFSNLPGPQIVAKTYEQKVEQFKAHLPVLRTISNRGIKDRHWQQVTRNSFYKIHFVTAMCPRTPVAHLSDMVFSSCRSALLWALKSNRPRPLHCLTCWRQDFLILLTSKSKLLQ